eukprot:gnl/TRDRNA2_/TRDRNA2_176626_c0_seq2.p1 gnl/TRDRNA2_/TRDRNA2_176626_c0~~gnl/TRDRNA2_/TRDRNA2_176626_c0_seq2.p1  ORF type:complete len:428 (+),score=42.48 gnl/TRDRNA2_/TRDRNA2_176626_c0_seq2:84-1367(+)
MQARTGSKQGQISTAENDPSAANSSAAQTRWSQAFQEMKRQSTGKKSTFKHDCLRQFTLFNERDPKFLESLMMVLQVEVFTEGKEIVHQGAITEKVYFLIHGEVGVLSGRRMIQLATLRAGTCFGEALSLGVIKPSPTTLRALSFCDCRVVHKRCFAKILAQFPNEARFFKKLAQRNDNILTHSSLETSFLGDNTDADTLCAKHAAGFSKTLPAATPDDHHDAERDSKLAERRAFRVMEQKLQIVTSRLLIDDVARSPRSPTLSEEPSSSRSLPSRRSIMRGIADIRLPLVQPDSQEPASSRSLPSRRSSARGTASTRLPLTQGSNKQEPSSSRSVPSRHSSTTTPTSCEESVHSRQLMSPATVPFSSRSSTPRRSSLWADRRLPEAWPDSPCTSGTTLRDVLKLQSVRQKSEKPVDSPTSECFYKH